MNNVIKVLGTEEINGTKFTGIEGGFGEGKRSMLARDIAEANRTTTKKLNQNIERNRKRFKDEVDLIDLNSNSVVTHSDLEKMGFSQNAINRSSNIYLLSERGYAKLLKIMDSDEAWEQYDKFVDGYFQYRKAVRGYQAEPQYKLPQNYSEALRELANSTDKIAELQPKANFADAVANSDDAIQIAGLAKLMRQNGIDIGEKRLFSWLRDNEYLKKRHGLEWNKPTQKSMDMELFKVVEKVKELPDGVVRLTSTTLVTGKGQQYFINKFLGTRGQIMLDMEA